MTKVNDFSIQMISSINNINVFFISRNKISIRFDCDQQF